MAEKRKSVFITIIAAAAAAAVLAAALGGRSGIRGGSQDAAYVEPVANMAGGASSGTLNRYSGIVESQETWDINLSQDQSVKEILVSVGDTVQEGTPLFSYNTDDMKLQLSQAKLELEEMGNEVKNYNSQIKALKAEKAAAPKEEQFNYTVQIQSLETSIRQSEYNQQSKQMEIDKLKNALDQATVTSKINGVVKSIHENKSTEENGETKPFMSILTAGDYRVKGLINETNAWMISEGQPVILRSRIDENQTWTGTIQKIDTENAEKGNSTSSYAGDSESGSQSSRYPFYVSLDSSEGLMMGQHLYIELDEGQTEKKEGIWIYSGYLVYDDVSGAGSGADAESLSAEPESSEKGSAWVWADDGKGRLRKCPVELGEYDAGMDLYQLVSGLEDDALSAWPVEGFSEGMKTTTEIADSMSETEGEEVPASEGGMDDAASGDENQIQEDAE